MVKFLIGLSLFFMPICSQFLYAEITDTTVKVVSDHSEKEAGKVALFEVLKKRLEKAKNQTFESACLQDTIEYTAKTLGIAVALLAILQFQETPKGYWGFIKTVFFVTITAGIGGGMISSLFMPFLKLVLERKYDAPYVETMQEFIAQWQQFRKFVPRKQQKKFDELFVMYQKNNGILLIPESFAQGLLTELFLSVLEDEVVDGVVAA